MSGQNYLVVRPTVSVCTTVLQRPGARLTSLPLFDPPCELSARFSQCFPAFPPHHNGTKTITMTAESCRDLELTQHLSHTIALTHSRHNKSVQIQ